MAAVSRPATSNELLYVGFNQDFGCFAVGTDTGFRIYNCEPFKETFRRDFSSGGGVAIVEMLFRCNILALVGGGRQPRYPPHKVMVWDDHQARCIGELSFRSEVRAVRLRRDKVIVGLSTRVYVYNFADLTLIDHIETMDNSLGLCAVTANPHPCVLACPGTTVGSVRVEHYIDRRRSVLIQAHDNELRCISLNAQGTRLATASEKGTLIRIFDTNSGEILQELRRGSDKADIYCIAFHPSSPLLCCTSDKGTVHIFRLNEKVAEGSQGSASDHGANAPAGARNGGAGATASDATASGAGVSVDESQREYFSSGVPSGGGAKASSSSTWKSLLVPKYFTSERSFAQFGLDNDGARSICAFGHEANSIIVVDANGQFVKAQYDPDKGGEATRTLLSQFAGPGT